MIYIVTGNRDCGKTTYLKAIIEDLTDCDGILSLKDFDDDRFKGYRLYHIRTGMSFAFITNEDLSHRPARLRKDNRELGDFTFLGTGIEVGKAILNKAVTEGKTLIIDEVAQMELAGEVFFEEIKRAVDQQKKCQHTTIDNDKCIQDLYLVVREGLVEKVIEKFQIEEFEIIEVNEGENRL